MTFHIRHSTSHIPRFALPLLLVLLALGARLAFLRLSGAYGQIVNDDGARYARLALSLLSGDGYAWGPGQPTAHRPYGYPWLLAAIVGVFGPSMAAVQWVQAVLGSLVVLPTYALGRRLGGTGTAALAGLAVALHPVLIYLAALAAPDAAALACQMGLLWCAWAIAAAPEPLPRTPAAPRGAWAGFVACAAAAILLRPELLLVVWLAPAAVWLAARGQGPARAGPENESPSTLSGGRQHPERNEAESKDADRSRRARPCSTPLRTLRLRSRNSTATPLRACPELVEGVLRSIFLGRGAARDMGICPEPVEGSARPQESGVGALCAAAALATALALLPPTIRNAAVFREFIPLPTFGGAAFWGANNAEADGGWVMPSAATWPDGEPPDLGTRGWPGLTETQSQARFYRAAFAWMRRAPAAALALIPRKLARSWTLSYSDEARPDPLPGWLARLNAVFGLAALAGIARAFRCWNAEQYEPAGSGRPEGQTAQPANVRTLTALLLVPVAAWLIKTVLFYGSARQTAAALPALCIFAAFAAVGLAGWARRRGA